MDFNSKEDLQKELDQIDKDIKKAQLKVSNLLTYRETIAMRLNELMEGKRKVVNTSKFDNADVFELDINYLVINIEFIKR